MATNDTFELRGVNHLALVTSDMARTIEFYSGVLGMPLVKTMDIPGDGQHFFFDIGNGDCLAFFWFPHAPAAQPGVGNAGGLPGLADFTSAHASMNHLAFDVPLERFEEYREKLIAAGVEVSPILDHDDSELTVARAFHEGVFVRSFYFRDPDGVLLEFASWTRPLDPATDLGVRPKNAAGEYV